MEQSRYRDITNVKAECVRLQSAVLMNAVGSGNLFFPFRYKLPAISKEFLNNALPSVEGVTMYQAMMSYMGFGYENVIECENMQSYYRGLHHLLGVKFATYYPQYYDRRALFC